MKKFLLRYFMAVLCLTVTALLSAETYSYTFTKAGGGNVFTSKNDTKDLGTLRWTLATDQDLVTAFNEADGLHIGTTKTPPSSVLLSTESLSDKTIKSIKINTKTGTKAAVSLSVKVGGSTFGPEVSSISTSELTDYTFTGEAKGNVELSWTFVSGTKKAIYIKSIEIEYEVAVATPTASVSTGSFREPFEVELSCATQGAEIYYTLNGDEPAASSTKYEQAITINKTTTLKAIAVKGEDKSALFLATYTFVEKVDNIAAFIEKADKDNEVIISGTVTVAYSDGGDNHFIKDETGYLMVYGKMEGLKNGSTLTGLSGKYAEFYGAPEIKPVEVPEAVDGVAVEPAEMKLDKVSGAKFNDYIVVKGVEIQSDITFGETAKNVTFVDGEKTLAGRNQFNAVKGTFTAGKYYKVEGFVGQYKGAPQLLIISIEEMARPSLAFKVYSDEACETEFTGEAFERGVTYYVKAGVDNVGDYGNTMVIAKGNFTNSAALNVEYYETAEGSEGWRALPLDAEGNYVFGPAATGFPLKPVYSSFRITVKREAAAENFKSGFGVYRFNNSPEELTEEIAKIESEAISIKAPYTLTLVADEAMGKVEITEGAQTAYILGDKVTIAATANDGYEFVSWTDDVTAATRQIVINGNATYTATFKEATTPEEPTSVTIDFNEVGTSLAPNPSDYVAFAGYTKDGVVLTNETALDKTNFCWNIVDDKYVLESYVSGTSKGTLGITADKEVSSVVFTAVRYENSDHYPYKPECNLAGNFSFDGDVITWTPDAPVGANTLMTFHLGYRARMFTVTVNFVGGGETPEPEESDFIVTDLMGSAFTDLGGNKGQIEFADASETIALSIKANFTVKNAWFEPDYEGNHEDGVIKINGENVDSYEPVLADINGSGYTFMITVAEASQLNGYSFYLYANDENDNAKRYMFTIKAPETAQPTVTITGEKFIDNEMRFGTVNVNETTTATFNVKVENLPVTAGKLGFEFNGVGADGQLATHGFSATDFTNEQLAAGVDVTFTLKGLANKAGDNTKELLLYDAENGETYWKGNVTWTVNSGIVVTIDNKEALTVTEPITVGGGAKTITIHVTATGLTENLTIACNPEKAQSYGNRNITIAPATLTPEEAAAGADVTITIADKLIPSSDSDSDGDAYIEFIHMGAVIEHVTATWTVKDLTPSLTVKGTFEMFMEVTAGGEPATGTITITAENLTEKIVVTSPYEWITVDPAEITEGINGVHTVNVTVAPGETVEAKNYGQVVFEITSGDLKKTTKINDLTVLAGETPQPTTFTVSGKVIDEAGAAIEGVAVAATFPMGTDGKYETATTDAEGKYSFEFAVPTSDLKMGNITFTKAGYVGASKVINYTDGDIEVGDIVLKAEAVEPKTPTITIDNATVTVAGEFEAGANVEATFTVKAADLTNAITFAAEGVTFDPATIAADAEGLATGVAVKASFKAAATVGENIITITVASEGAASKTVTVKYTVKKAVEPAVDDVVMNANVWAADGMLFIESDVQATATVYTVAGQAVRTLVLSEGVNAVELPTAMYVVKVNDSIVKIAVK